MHFDGDNLVIEDGCQSGTTFVVRCGGLISEPIPVDSGPCGGTRVAVFRPAVPVKLVLVPDDGVAPPVNVKLHLQEKPGHSTPSPSRELVFLATPDRRGIVSTELPEGRWNLTLLTRDFAPVTLWNVELRPGVPFEHSRLSLSRGASVLVHAVDSRNGYPLGGARVCLVEERHLEATVVELAQDRMPGSARCGSTGQDGWFRFSGLPEGDYLLVTSAPDFSVGCRRVTLSEDAETVVGDLEVPRPVTLLLSVTGASNLPSESKVAIVVTPEACGHPLMDLSVVASIPPGGDIPLEPMLPGHLRVEPTVITPSGLAATVDQLTLDTFPGEVRSFVLDLSGSLFSGTVTFRDEPVAASLELRGHQDDEPLRSAAQSGTDGEFSVILKEPGLYDVRVLAENPQLDTVVSQVPFSDPEEAIEIVIPDTAIRGTVVSEDGEPVRHAEVEGRLLGDDSDARDLSSPLRVFRARTTSGQDGWFALEGLVPGRWVVTASQGDLSSDSTRIEVSDGESIENVVLTLKEELNIRGTVRTTRGVPVRSSHVILVAGGSGLESAVALTDASGGFTATLGAKAGQRANVAIIGGTGVSWCGRQDIAEEMALVLPTAGGTVVCSSGPKGPLSTPRKLALIRTDGSFLGITELLTFGGAQLSHSEEQAVLTIPGLAPGQWRIVQITSPAEYFPVINGDGLQLAPLAEFSAVPGNLVRVTLPSPK